MNANVKIFTDQIDEKSQAQIARLVAQPAFSKAKVRIMPDVHPGKVGTIGLTMTISTKVMPNLIGIDIGCGMTLARIKGKKVEFQKLDTVIRDNIPSGFAIRSRVHRFAETFDFIELHCYKHIQKESTLASVYLIAGDMDKDDEIGYLDYVMIYNKKQAMDGGSN